MEREVDHPVLVGRRGLGRHHPRGEPAEDGGELTEPARDQLDVGPLGQQDALGRPEEPRTGRRRWGGRARCSSRGGGPRRRSGPPSRRGSPRAVRKASGLAGPSPNPMVSRVRISGAASSGVQKRGCHGPSVSSGRRPPVVTADRCRRPASGRPPGRCDAWARWNGRPSTPSWRASRTRPTQARRLEELGVDGAFTFEGPHDVFTPARPGRRGHLLARAGHQRGHRLPPQPGPARPPGLRPPAAVTGPVHPGARVARSGPRWRSATARPSTGRSPGCGSSSGRCGPSSPRGRSGSGSTSAASSPPTP